MHTVSIKIAFASHINASTLQSARWVRHAPRLGATLQLTGRHRQFLLEFPREPNTVCLAQKYTANTLHAQAVWHWQALRFHPVLRRCLKGFITVTAPLQHPTPPPPPFSSSSLSEVSFFPLLVPFPSLLSSGVLLRVPLKAHSRGLAPITAFTSPRSVHRG